VYITESFIKCIIITHKTYNITQKKPSPAKRLASLATATRWGPQEKFATKPVDNVLARTASPVANAIDAPKAISKADLLLPPASRYPDPPFTTRPKTMGTAAMPPKRPTVVPIVGHLPRG